MLVVLWFGHSGGKQHGSGDRALIKASLLSVRFYIKFAFHLGEMQFGIGMTADITHGVDFLRGSLAGGAMIGEELSTWDPDQWGVAWVPSSQHCYSLQEEIKSKARLKKIPLVVTVCNGIEGDKRTSFPHVNGRRGVVVGTDVVSESTNPGNLLYGWDFGSMGTSVVVAQVAWGATRSASQSAARRSQKIARLSRRRLQKNGRSHHL